MIFNCKTCGSSFGRKLSVRTYTFCSRQCSAVARRKPKLTCVVCSASFSRRGRQRYNRKFCSQKCFHTANSGVGNYQWEGGKYKTKAGYVNVSIGSGRSRREHVLIAEKVLGRKLKSGEIVHHINGDKGDNRHENLLICTQGYHRWLHHRMSELYQQEHFGTYTTTLT